MKTIIIIIILTSIALKVLTNTKVYHEARLICEVRKHINDTGFLKGVRLNSIQHEAACLLMADKISWDFYAKVFAGGKLQTPWWEVNRTTIENYGKKKA